MENRLAAISGGVMYCSSSILGEENCSTDDKKETKDFILKPAALGSLSFFFIYLSISKQKF